MKRELEACGDSEIAATAAQPPKKIKVFIVGRRQYAAVRGYQLNRDQVVDRVAILAHYSK
jgi:hypothetical protein